MSWCLKRSKVFLPSVLQVEARTSSHAPVSGKRQETVHWQLCSYFPKSSLSLQSNWSNKIRHDIPGHITIWRWYTKRMLRHYTEYWIFNITYWKLFTSHWGQCITLNTERHTQKILIVDNVLKTTHWRQYIAHWKHYTTQLRQQHTTHWRQYIIYTGESTRHHENRTSCTEHCAPYTEDIHYTLKTVHNTLKTVHHILKTSHTEDSTPNTEDCTLHTEDSTPHTEDSTSHTLIRHHTL